MGSVRVNKRVREALRAYADENEMTYDEAVRDLLPDEELTIGRPVFVDLDIEVHDELLQAAGTGVDLGEVIQYRLITETDYDPYQHDD